MPRIDTVQRIVSASGKDIAHIISPQGRVFWSKPGTTPPTIGAPAPEPPPVTDPPPATGEAAVRMTSAMWTTPLHPQSMVDENSDAMVQALVAQVESETFVNAAGQPDRYGTRKAGAGPLNMHTSGPYRTDVSVGDLSICVYRVPPDQPRVLVGAIRNGWRSKFYPPSGTPRTYLQDDLDADGGVPLPDPATMPDGKLAPNGDDGAVIIIQGNKVWEIWRLRPSVAGGLAEQNGYPWQCDQAGVIADARYHPGVFSSSYSGVSPWGGDFGLSATGIPYLGGMLTGRDWRRFQAGLPLDHMLFCAVPLPGAQVASATVPGSVNTPNNVLPATRGDRWNFTYTSDADAAPYRLPEGTRFRLPLDGWSDAQIDAYAATKGVSSAGRNGARAPVLAWILKGIRDYGFMVIDAAGIVGFSAEASKTFKTPWNPWPAADNPPSWGNFPYQFPWRSLVQVARPTVQDHTPGLGPTTPQPSKYDYSFAPPVDTLVTGRNLLLTKSDFAPVIRYAEAGRKKLVVRNADPQGREVGVAYAGDTNASSTGPSAWTVIPAGSEWVDTSGDGRRLFCRTTPGQSVSGNVTVEVYAEVAP